MARTLGTHVGQDRLGAADDAPEIGFEDALARLDVHVLDRRIVGDACVVDQDIHRPCVGFDSGDGVAHRSVVVDVEGDGLEFGPGSGGALQQFRGLADVSHASKNLVALGGEQDCRRSPNPRIGTRNQYSAHDFVSPSECGGWSDRSLDRAGRVPSGEKIASRAPYSRGSAGRRPVPALGYGHAVA